MLLQADLLLCWNFTSCVAKLLVSRLEVRPIEDILSFHCAVVGVVVTMMDHCWQNLNSLSGYSFTGLYDVTDNVTGKKRTSYCQRNGHPKEIYIDTKLLAIARGHGCDKYFLLVCSCGTHNMDILNNDFLSSIQGLKYSMHCFSHRVCWWSRFVRGHGSRRRCHFWEFDRYRSQEIGASIGISNHK